MTHCFVVLSLEKFRNIQNLQRLWLNDLLQPKQTDVGNQVLVPTLESIQDHFKVSLNLFYRFFELNTHEL